MRTDRNAGAAGSATVAGLALVILVVLGGGVTGVAVHHGDAPSGHGAAPSTPDSTPPGFRRISDRLDQLSIAVPEQWRTVAVTTGNLADGLRNLEAANPELKSLIEPAIAASARYQIGTFAVDSVTRTILFTFGTDVPAGTSINDVSIGDFGKEITKAGGTNVQSSRVRLPVGQSYQVAFLLTVKGVAVNEIVNFFVHAGRVVFLELVAPFGTDQSALYHQVQSSLETTG